MPVSLSAENVEGVIVLRTAGELDAESVKKLQEAIRLMAENGSLRCVVDLSAVAVADGPGYVGLLTSNRIMRDAGGVLAVASMNRQVYDSLVRAGARENLRMFADTPNAVETLRDTPILQPDEGSDGIQAARARRRPADGVAGEGESREFPDGEEAAVSGAAGSDTGAGAQGSRSRGRPARPGAPWILPGKSVNVEQVLKTYHEMAGPEINAPEPPGPMRLWMQAVAATGVTFNAAGLLIAAAMAVWGVRGIAESGGVGSLFWLSCAGSVAFFYVAAFKPEFSRTFLALASVTVMGTLMVIAGKASPAGSIPLLPMGTLLKYSVLAVLGFCVLDAAASRLPIVMRGLFGALALYSSFGLVALPYHTLDAAMKAKIFESPSILEPAYALVLLTFPVYLGWTILRMIAQARKGGANTAMPLFGLMAGFAGAGLAWVACMAAL